MAIAYTLHDVQLGAIAASVRSASPLWIAAMLPTHVVVIWVRARRWRHLVAPLATVAVPVPALFRATAVGFMAINLLPFRLGELVRPWFLSQETELRTATALGTLVVERAFDFATLAMLGGIMLLVHSQTLPVWVRSGALLVMGLSCVPVAMIMALRLDDAVVLRLVRRFSRHLPESVAEGLLELVEEVCNGIVSLRGARAVTWVLVDSILLWAVVIPLNFVWGFRAFGIDLPLGEALRAALTVHVFVAVAVAAPSAPGFFGVYHFACREALALFGIAPTTAVAYGTVAHLTYWLPVTLAGLLSFASADLRFGDLTAAALGKGRSERHR